MPEQALHKCPADGCTTEVPFDILACKVHWFQLPEPLRRSISRHWRNSELDDWAHARAQAVRILSGKGS